MASLFRHSGGVEAVSAFTVPRQTAFGAASADTTDHALPGQKIGVPKLGRSRKGPMPAPGG